MRATGLTNRNTYMRPNTAHRNSEIVYREKEGQKIYIARFLFQL